MFPKYQRAFQYRFIKFSVILNLFGMVFILFFPRYWKIGLGVIFCDHLIIFIGSVIPKSILLGKNIIRLPNDIEFINKVGLTFDDGPDPKVTPEILTILDRYAVKATFFCIGERAAIFPEIIDLIVQKGHFVENHSYQHKNYFAFCGPKKMGNEIDKAQDTLFQISGSKPNYFRAPAGMKNPWLESVLWRRGLQLVTWSKRGFDTVCRDPGLVLSLITRNLCGRDIILLHDGSSAKDHNGIPVVISVLPNLLDRMNYLNLEACPLPMPE